MARSAKVQALPTTAFAILGLLSFGETSGYDLGKIVDQTVAYFFSPAKSHIYAELRRLVAAGYAKERAVRQKDRPDKRLYRITPRGQTALREWIESPAVEPEVFRSPQLLRLFFGNAADPEALSAQIKDYREQARARLEEYAQLERGLAGNDDVLFPYLTLRCGIAHTRAAISWADEVLKSLSKKR